MLRPSSVGQRLRLFPSHARRLVRLDLLAVHRQSIHFRHHWRCGLLLLPRWCPGVGCMDAASWRHRRLMRLPFVANRQRGSLLPTRHLMDVVSAWNVILVDQSKRKSRKDVEKGSALYSILIANTKGATMRPCPSSELPYPCILTAALKRESSSERAGSAARLEPASTIASL